MKSSISDVMTIIINNGKWDLNNRNQESCGFLFLFFSLVSQGSAQSRSSNPFAALK